MRFFGYVPIRIQKYPWNTGDTTACRRMGDFSRRIGFRQLPGMSRMPGSVKRKKDTMPEMLAH
jgi:hypothetical protein